jgi:hypothetical protein
LHYIAFDVFETSSLGFDDARVLPFPLGIARSTRRPGVSTIGEVFPLLDLLGRLSRPRCRGIELGTPRRRGPNVIFDEATDAADGCSGGVQITLLIAPFGLEFFALDALLLAFVLQPN